MLQSQEGSLKEIEMVKLLKIWVEDQTVKKIRNSSHKEKAPSIYKSLKYKSPNPAEMVS